MRVRRKGGAGSRGVELLFWMLLTLSVKDNRKKNKVSVKFNSRPRKILLGTFFDSEQLFGE